LEEKVAIYHTEFSIFYKKDMFLAFLPHLHVFGAPGDRDAGWHNLPSAIGSELVPGKQKRQHCNSHSAEP